MVLAGSIGSIHDTRFAPGAKDKAAQKAAQSRTGNWEEKREFGADAKSI